MLFKARSGTVRNYPCECMELFGEGTLHYFRDDQLAFADHVHQFNTSQHIAGSAERFETHHGYIELADGLGDHLYCLTER